METPEQYVKKSIQRKQLRNQTDVVCFNCWQVNAVWETAETQSDCENLQLEAKKW